MAAGLGAETTLALRFTFAGVIWWTLLLARRKPLWVGIRWAVRTTVLGAVLAAHALAYYWGTARVTGALAAIAVAVVPVIVALLARLLLKERLGRSGWLALALAMLGGAILTGRPRGSADLVGLLCLGVALLVYSLYVVAGIPLVRMLSSPNATAYIITGAALFSWTVGALSNHLDFGFDTAGWMAIAGLALFPTVVGISAFLAGAEILGATRAAILGTLEPVVGLVLSILILGDRPSTLQIAGGGLVLLAAIMVQVERHQMRHFDSMAPS